MTKKVAKLQRASLQNPVKVEVSTKSVNNSFNKNLVYYLLTLFVKFEVSNLDNKNEF